MRAALYYGKDIAEAPCGEGRVGVSPAFVENCGTDLHEYLGGPTLASASPHPVP